MKNRSTLILVLLAALGLSVSTALAGGWAVVTLEDWPEDVRAGETFAIEFSVRQHGQALAGGYEPMIRASHPESGDQLEFTAFETKRTGFYAAELAFPEPGEWKWSISYYGEANFAQTMPELRVSEPDAALGAAARGSGDLQQALSAGYVVAALGTLTLFAGAGFYAVTRSRGAVAAALCGLLVIAAGLLLVPRAQAAAQASPVESKIAPVETVSLYDQGRVLFQAKGCIVCHNHAELRQAFTGITTDIGPDFTWGTKRPVEFLRSWLADPQFFKPDTPMPNLELSEAEIEALAAFLMGELGP